MTGHFSVLALWRLTYHEQLLLSWAAGLGAACGGGHKIIYCKRFNMSFQSPESAIISIGTVDRRLGWGSIPIAPSCEELEIHIY